MIYMTHPVHGAMNCYLDSEVENNKKNGWIVGEMNTVVDKQIASCETPEQQYEKKFGRPPHHRMKLENIKASLEE